MSVVKEFRVDKLDVRVYDNRMEMGRVAAADIERKIVELLEYKEVVTIVFAAAPSQNEVLQNLRDSEEIDWTRVIALHMDEYIGLNRDAPQRFGNFLKEAIFQHVNLKKIHYLDSFALDYNGECERYSGLLREHKPDITIMGIGENGHIAFNDPPVADFADPELMKIVELDQICRQQQVNDGCFDSLDDVPEFAITMTIPALLLSDYLFCVVPDTRKEPAVTRMLQGRVDTECPATVLRHAVNARLYLDTDSAAGVI